MLSFTGVPLVFMIMIPLGQFYRQTRLRLALVEFRWFPLVGRERERESGGDGVDRC